MENLSGNEVKEIMKWTEIEIKSFESFVKILEQTNLHVEYRRLAYFRGQSNEAWTLKPSILRLFDGSNLTRSVANKIENNAIERFYSSVHIFMTNYNCDRHRTLIDRLALLQHNSCPTRLLDWTMSPYVALYFASNQEPDKNGAIWHFNPAVIRGGQKDKYGNKEFEIKTDEKEPNLIYFIENSFHTERSFAQQSAFTICNDILRDHVDPIIDMLGEQSKHYFCKFIIPANKKYDFLSQLHTMNITANSLFPGVDGLGKSIHELVRLRIQENKKFHESFD